MTDVHTEKLKRLVADRETMLRLRDDSDPDAAALCAVFDRKAADLRETGPWIQTAQGRVYPLLWPRASDVHITEIAYALAGLPRYTGHAARCDSAHCYTVAQHSVLTSYVVPEEHAFAALMHDAAEAYVGDMSSPMKRCVPEFAYVERLSWLAIVERWPRLPRELPAEVKHADLVMLATEKRDLLGPEPKAWIPMPPPSEQRISIWPADVAERAFLERFVELCPDEQALAWLVERRAER